MTTNKASSNPDASDDLRYEYRLGCAQSRPNRFASRRTDTTVAVDPPGCIGDNTALIIRAGTDRGD